MLLSIGSTRASAASKRLGLAGYAVVIALLAFTASSQAGEEYSRSGAGDRLNVRLGPGAVNQPPGVPKSLESLQRLTGDLFLCVERDNFLIASDLDLERAEYLVDGVFDFCRRALINTFFDQLPDPGRVITLYVFRDYNSYVAGLRKFFAMDPISPYGHYGHTQKYLVVNYDTGPGTMVHEMTHALMSDDFPDAPIWLAEGLASLYEQCRAEGNYLRGEDNWRLPELKEALQRDVLTPLARLMAMTPATFRAEKESLNYAQARYFCKYLEELGLLAPIYKEFRGKAKLDPTGGRFVIQAFGKPLDSIENAWKRWISFQHWSE